MNERDLQQLETWIREGKVRLQRKPSKPIKALKIRKDKIREGRIKPAPGTGTGTGIYPGGDPGGGAVPTPPISSEKTPDDICRTAVRASLSSRRGKSIREIAKLCDLGISATRRHLRSLIAEGHAKQVGRGSGTKYLSSSPGKRSRPTTDLTPEQIEQAQQGMDEVLKHLLSNVRKYKSRRIAQADKATKEFVQLIERHYREDAAAAQAAAHKQAAAHADAQGRKGADD